MDERELRDRANTLHDYLVGVDDRERAAEKRHAEMMRAIEQLNKTIERCTRDLVGALRTQGR